MAVKAYILIETKVGKTKEVVEAIRRLERVVSDSNRIREIVNRLLLSK